MIFIHTRIFHFPAHINDIIILSRRHLLLWNCEMNIKTIYYFLKIRSAGGELNLKIITVTDWTSLVVLKGTKTDNRLHKIYFDLMYCQRCMLPLQLVRSNQCTSSITNLGALLWHRQLEMNGNYSAVNKTNNILTFIT